MCFNELIYGFFFKITQLVSNFQIKTMENWTILGAFLYLQTVLFFGDITPEKVDLLPLMVQKVNPFVIPALNIFLYQVLILLLEELKHHNI